MTDLNWSELQHQAKDVLLPDDEYVAIVIESSATNSSTGKPMIKLKFAIVEGPYRDRKVFSQLTLSPENPFALQKWFENLAAFGLDSSYFDNNNPSMETLARELLNRGVVIKLGHHTYNGSERNSVDSFRPFAPNGPTPPGMILGPARIPSGPQIGANPSVSANPGTPTSVNASPTENGGSSAPTPTRAF